MSRGLACTKFPRKVTCRRAFKSTIAEDFRGLLDPLTRSKRVNAAILVVDDAFSKFANSFPVRRITSQIVIECLERAYFPTCGVPTALVTDNAAVFVSKLIKDQCFRWGVNHI